MAKRIVSLLLLLVAATVSALGQKSVVDEVGFKPERLYQFNDVDAVNLFNGNVTVTIPIGQSYSVGSFLAYQFRLIFNGKNYEYEWYHCGEDETDPVQYCEDAVPSRQSNAGLGWRISLGRLLDPYDSGRNSTFDRFNWLYEGPTGDEHEFPAEAADATVSLSSDPQPLRLLKIDASTRAVEFPSGEVHEFVERDGVWRLSEMRDRYGNFVQIGYTFVVIDGRECETTWTVTDSAGRSHTVELAHHPALYETWSRGQNIQKVSLEGYAGSVSTYTFQYDPSGETLEAVHLPLASSLPYAFAYTTEAVITNEWRLRRITLPTGGSVAYTYQNYYFATESHEICANGPWGTDTHTPGVKTRTVSDGGTSYTWEYVQRRGPEVPVAWTDPQKCHDFETEVNYYGPYYWSRTSVLSPLDSTGRRSRSDHYFNIFGEPAYPDIVAHPFPAANDLPFGYAGVGGRPPDDVAKGPVTGVPEETAGYPADVSGADGTTGERYLSSRVYDNCDADGDCTNGELLRSTYVRYACATQQPSNCWTESTRTVHEDDTSCGNACYTQETLGGLTSTGWHTTATTESNIPADDRTCTAAAPCGNVIVSSDTTAYRQWTEAEKYSVQNAWVTGTYTERSRTEYNGGISSEVRSLFEFDIATGALKAGRTLKSATMTPDDILTVWTRDSKGNIVQERSYGGDDAGLDTSECCVTPSVAPQYLVSRTYDAANSLLSEAYLDPEECGDPDANCVIEPVLMARHFVRDVPSGLITTSRDAGGVPTTYDYDDIGRLKEIVPLEGATLSYAYSEATSSQNARATEQLVGNTGLLSEATYEFDGLGRVKRVSSPLPNGKLATTQTDYDERGRAMRISQPVERTVHPTASVGTHWTTTTVDALGRPRSVTAPDGSTTVIAYEGTRSIARTASVATPAGTATPTTTHERYDALGRLRAVTEPSGREPFGASTQRFTTTYEYDAGGRLTRVSSVDSVQPDRIFEYDGRGLLTREWHPESGESVYERFDSRGHPELRSYGGNTLEFKFDAAERLTDVLRRNGDGSTPIKAFVFAAGRLKTATRRNELAFAGTIDVTETYGYSNGGLLQQRATLVEKVDGTTRTEVQRFSYEVLHDAWRLPNILTMPTCSLHGCSATPGVADITFTRDAGRLTSIDGFAEIEYHPSGMARSVEHHSVPRATDVYSVAFGLPRPTLITFGGGTLPPPCTTPGAVVTTETTIAPRAQAAASTPLIEGATYVWSINNGTIVGAGNGSTVQYVSECAGVVTLTVDVTAACGTSARATQTVQITPGIEWPQNQHELINSGEEATFKVGSLPAGATIKWYRGAAGDTSHHVFTGAPFETPELLETTRYWARVTLVNGCTADSRTLTAEVCRLPEITFPSADATVARQVIAGTAVHAEVTAVASAISYVWHQVLLESVNGVFTETGAEPVLLPSTAAEVDWVAPAVTAPQHWGLRVTVSGGCQGAIPRTRMVEIFTVVPTVDCVAPKFARYLPPERRVAWPGHRIELEVALADGANPAEYTFEWTIDGVYRRGGKGEVSFSVALEDLQPRLIGVRVFKECADGSRSAEITDATYLYTDEDCPIPPLSVDQTQVTADLGTFTASSVWPSVDFQWYEGDSGTTNDPIAYAAGGTRRTYSPGEPGTYWVRATSTCGTTADSPTLLAVTASCTPLQFIRQPAPHSTSHAGSPVTLSFETDPNFGTAQWRENEIPLGGAIKTPELIVSPTQTTTYDVLAKAASGCHTARSRDAVVHILSCDQIAVQQAPIAASIVKGDAAELSVEATSSLPLTYQWYEGVTGDTSVPVPDDATSALLTPRPDKTTRYWVRITAGSVCAIDTVDVPVSVCGMPEISPSEMTEIVSPIPNWWYWIEPTVTGDNLTYTWYDGLITTKLEDATVLRTGKSIDLSPDETTQFWLRVTSDCVAPVQDTAATLQYRISVCPEIVSQPVALRPKVMPDTKTTLTLQALREEVVRWYKGDEYIKSGASIETPAITGPTTFFARVESGLCSIISESVTVTVCDQPTIGWCSGCRKDSSRF